MTSPFVGDDAVNKRLRAGRLTLWFKDKLTQQELMIREGQPRSREIPRGTLHGILSEPFYGGPRDS